MVAEQQVRRRAWEVLRQGRDERPDVLEHNFDRAISRRGIKYRVSLAKFNVNVVLL